MLLFNPEKAVAFWENIKENANSRNYVDTHYEVEHLLNSFDTSVTLNDLYVARNLAMYLCCFFDKCDQDKQAFRSANFDTLRSKVYGAADRWFSQITSRHNQVVKTLNIDAYLDRLHFEQGHTSVLTRSERQELNERVCRLLWASKMFTLTASADNCLREFLSWVICYSLSGPDEMYSMETRNVSYISFGEYRNAYFTPAYFIVSDEVFQKLGLVRVEDNLEGYVYNEICRLARSYEAFCDTDCHEQIRYLAKTCVEFDSRTYCEKLLLDFSTLIRSENFGCCEVKKLVL